MRGWLLAVAALTLVLAACGGKSDDGGPSGGASCGNGAVDAGETCDSGAANSNIKPDACRLDCQKARCGDQVVDSGEGCDDGNTEDTDACTSSCQPATCGDGLVQAGVEACDDGPQNSDTAPGACRTSCKKASCGDGITDPPEACDDGNQVDDDGCTNACTLPRCGDGIKQTGEACDNGAQNSNDVANACRTDCSSARCGDGVKDDGEACDDGNRVDTDGCSNACALAVCGDGIVQTGEECDHGAQNSDTQADACRLSCKKAGCGDGTLDTAEACDDGNTLDTDACTSKCQPAKCGDGFVEAGVEECDNGAANSSTKADACRTTCKKASCGDKVVDTGETCDDANVVNDDACTNACQVAVCGDGILEAGVETCDDGINNSDTAPNACRTSCLPPSCGDGVVDNGETCDDGNTVDTDKCTASCVPAVCGDGIVEGGVEECDDGGKNDDAAPDACRTSCKAASCGDGVKDKGESCDDGNADDGDGCSAKCFVELPAPGDDVTVQGSLDDGDSTWSRPEADCATNNKGSYYYDAVTFVNSGKDPLILQVNGSFQDNGYLFVYGTFDSGKPTSECLAGNDDATSENTGSEVEGMQVQAGETITAVITCNAASTAIGAWSLDVQTSICGDGDMGPGETCDDGNTDPGDGCSATCQDGTLRESEPNGDTDSPSRVAVGQVARAAMVPADDQDLFTFEATGGTSYVVRTWAGSVGACDVGKGDSNDTYLWVFDAKSLVSVVNDNAFFGGPCSEVEFAAPKDGTYYVYVQSADFETIDPYFVEVTEVVQESEPNDDSKSATALGVRQTAQGAISKNDNQDTDYYSFEAKGGVTYTLLTFAGEMDACYPLNGNSYEPTITIWDADGNNQGFDDGDGLAPCAQLSFTPQADGTYYVEVDGNDTVDPYFLQIMGP